jgi:hypothetical protein
MSKFHNASPIVSLFILVIYLRVQALIIFVFNSLEPLYFGKSRNEIYFKDEGCNTSCCKIC